MTEIAPPQKTNGKWTDYNPVRITAGAGMLDNLFALNPPLNTNGRILLLTSAGFINRGVVDRIKAKAKKRGLAKSLLIYDKATPNPELDLLDRLTRDLRCEDITGIIALGGGSALDMAKVISVALPGVIEHPLDMIFRQGRPYEWHTRIPVVAVPTTAGTGSEVTPFATVWDRENQKKHSVTGEMVFPVHALLDPELTLTLPHKETLYTGLDAISHALESLWNKNRTCISELFALKALSLANKAFPAAIKQPNNLHLREMLQKAALFSGLAISRTRTAIAHAISYPLTIHFGVPHGLACSFALPNIIKHYTVTLNSGLEKDTIAETFKIIEKLHLKDKIAAYTKGEDLSEYIGEMFNPERAENYVKLIIKEDVFNFIRK